MEHSGKKLHCIYEQRDGEGNNLFEGNQDDEDDVLIIVRYLEETSDEVETLPSGEVRISKIIDRKQWLLEYTTFEENIQICKWYSSFQQGQNYTITKEFMASPMPDSTKGEIKWEIEPLDGSHEPVIVSSLRNHFLTC